MTNPVIEEIQVLRFENAELRKDRAGLRAALTKLQQENLDLTLRFSSQLIQKQIAQRALEKAREWFSVNASCRSAEEMAAELRAAVFAIYAESEKAEAGLASIKRGMMAADVENADQDSPAAGGDAAGSQS